MSLNHSYTNPQFSLDFILQATRGVLFNSNEGANRIFSGVETDSRKDLKNKIFVALKGDVFDGHDFIKSAIEKGAGLILCHSSLNAEIQQALSQQVSPKTLIVKVEDTLIGLQELATAQRQSNSATIVGITGSNGKTTTKEFAASVLGAFKKVHYSKGSFNNHWGVPITLLEQPPEAEIALVEMGMNHAGEITRLCEIADPDIVLCTSVGKAHIEFFETVENIALAKEEIYKASRADALRIFNYDNPHTLKMYDQFQTSSSLVFSSENPQADVFFQLEELSFEGMKVKGHINGYKVAFEVPIFGKQNLINLMAAASIGLAAELDHTHIEEGLKHCQTIWGRNQRVPLKSGGFIIFDAYNANPDSMRSLLENARLIKNDGRRVGVFGQMLEMGAASPQLHEELGELAGHACFHDIWFIGADEKSFAKGLAKTPYLGHYKGSSEFEDSVARQLAQSLQKGDAALVKGSRGMKLERFVMLADPIQFNPK